MLFRWKLLAIQALGTLGARTEKALSLVERRTHIYRQPWIADKADEVRPAVPQETTHLTKKSGAGRVCGRNGSKKEFNQAYQMLFSMVI